jgi:hypothetical protein
MAQYGIEISSGFKGDTPARTKSHLLRSRPPARTSARADFLLKSALPA